ncbi:hypothetical protein MMC07_003119 [Pseudocyphellaria aurata]|nr:hypothetical protein [Pseudocyphellaria aurata]
MASQYIKFITVEPAVAQQLKTPELTKYARIMTITPSDPSPSCPILYYDVTCQRDVDRANAIENAKYNKHRDGLWSSNPDHIEYINEQKALNDIDMVRLYQGYLDKIARRWEALGNDWKKVEAEAGPIVWQQAQTLFYSHIWRKRTSVEPFPDYLDAIFKYWRDVSIDRPREDFGTLWEYVAEKTLPVQLMLDPVEQPRRVRAAADGGLPWESAKKRLRRPAVSQVIITEH